MKIEQIDAVDGQDPLVKGFEDLHGDACARKGISLTWCFLGLICSLAGAYAYLRFLGGYVYPTNADNSAGSGDNIHLITYLIHVPDMLIGLSIGCAWASIISRLYTYIFKKSPVVQECIYGGIAALAVYGILYALYIHFAKVAGIATAIICFIYLAVILFRLLALIVGWRGKSPADDGIEPVDWPMYTILVPLYKEKNVANNIVAALKKIDYPAESLDVKLLLEADDAETLSALEAANVPEWMEVIIVPDAQPRTKPRACNHGLQRARGEFLVIFDAEDRPEPDQLKKAVLRFDELADNVVCIQASLIYHNWRQNLLTRLFALEYNLWFLRYQPGLVRLGGPLPLGGTSNHFKIDALKKVGGWDPYNVTEDCDLGVRLEIHSYTCDLLDSITWEEANSQVGNWVRQRSRWLKGYMITHVVWFRHPLKMLRTLGLGGFIRFIMVVSSVGILTVINPILWIIMSIWAIATIHDLQLGYDIVELLTTRDAIHDRWSWPMLFMGAYENKNWAQISVVLFALSCILFAANFLFILINCLYGIRPGQRSLFWAALLSPFYWVLMSIAAWKALWQLIVKPHYWEKTVHGLDGSELNPEAEADAHDD